ncbi:MAG TPA: MotA/TolQ/ExbB proton channel family protein [Deltaproteobacteria bacterium]|jgi:biopolymer transport protein ExbB/TolQ|nr:MotA/TolQ/ExbB proton channel family protein [Deltaproteobacteria bacterium]
MNFFVDAMAKGGEFMYPILLSAIFALAIAVERMYYVMFRANINGTAFMAQVQKLIMANNIDRAIKLCNAEPNAALPRVLKAGLTRANRSEVEIQNAVDEAVLEIFPLLNKRTGYLPMLANVATLTGLLGTIQGLIVAFKAVATASAESKQTLLAAGISTAMYTTAGGLVVAIPTLVLHSIIAARTTKIMDDVDQFALKTVNLLGARRRGTLKEDGAAANG